MAGCVVFGLQFAPASHAAALGPGAIAAWIALIGFIAYRIEVDSKRLAGIAIIVSGVALILVASYRGHSLASAMIGDAMFLAASALGATYLVYIQRRRLDPVLAAALVCVASAMVVGPWHYFFAASAIATRADRESSRGSSSSRVSSSVAASFSRSTMQCSRWGARRSAFCRRWCR